MPEQSILDRRLTCNRIFRHLYTYCQQGFSGQLTVGGLAGEQWHIFLTRGVLVWATGGRHQKRRWRRQVYAIDKQKPNFSQIDFNNNPCWDYAELVQLSSQQQLSPEQLNSLLYGIFAEVLFDIVFEFEQPLRDLVSSSQPLVSVRHLAGIGDGMQLLAKPGILISKSHRFPLTLMPDVDTLQQRTQAEWEQWVELGLYKFSPNLAPAIGKTEELRAATSEKTYSFLTKLVDGKRTIRDIALKVKPDRSQLTVGRYLAPFVRRHLITLRRVGDLSTQQEPVSQKTITISHNQTIVCVDGEMDNRQAIETTLKEAGYAVTTMDDGIEALFQLSRPLANTPDLLLVSDRLTPLTANDLCRTLRRLTAWKHVAIVIYAGEDDVEPERIQHAMTAGATDYLSARNFTIERLVALLRGQVVPTPAPATSPRNNFWQSAFSTFTGN